MRDDTRIPMKSYDHQIRTLEDDPPPPICCRSDCEETATFECSYRWRAGWKLDREMIARLPLCTRHALEFVKKFAAKIETPPNPPMERGETMARRT